MESRVEAIARLRREASELREQASLLLATASARDYEADRLQDVGPDEDFKTVPYSEAVLQVLSSSGHEMSPKEIYQALLERGRNDPYASIGGILQGLKRQGRVDSPRRARWVALR
jgi:hypothetical protein